MDGLVSTNVNYTYEVLLNDIDRLKKAYPFLEVGYIGKSVLGRNIPYIKLGVGSKEVFYSASYHASEWITTPALMKFVQNFCSAYSADGLIYNYDAHLIFANTSIYIVPMVNPDGVDLVTGAIHPMTDDELANSDIILPPSLTSRDINNIYYNAKKIADDFPDIPFPSRMESKYNRCGFKPTISCWLGKSKKNQIFSRL